MIRECERPCVKSGQFDAGCRCDAEADTEAGKLLTALKDANVTSRPDYLMSLIEDAHNLIVAQQDALHLVMGYIDLESMAKYERLHAEYALEQGRKAIAGDLWPKCS